MAARAMKKPVIKASTLFQFSAETNGAKGCPTDPTTTTIIITSFVGTVKNKE